MPSVLVVDDQDPVRHLIREALEREGYNVEEACNGKEGLQRYREKCADLVLMDIFMPDKDGLECIMTLRREFPESRVVAMTGGSEGIGILNVLDVGRMLGVRRTLLKPFAIQALLELVAEEVSV